MYCFGNRRAKFISISVSSDGAFANIGMRQKARHFAVRYFGGHRQVFGIRKLNNPNKPIAANISDLIRALFLK
jgi:hypothetical protein